MTKLSVNLNKVALLRNQRDIGIPSVTRAARLCIAAGCHSVTVHPRPDERHIRRIDVYELADMLDLEFNIEGNPFPDFMDLVRAVRPTQCTLVPDSPGQRTSDHGWDLSHDSVRLTPIVGELQDLGIRVSLFLDPDVDQVKRAKELGTDRIELYTEPYAAAYASGKFEEGVAPYIRAAETALELGLGLNAGHDLNLYNLGPFCFAVPGILEVSIGHALTADALIMGLQNAVRAYLTALTVEIAPADTMASPGAAELLRELGDLNGPEAASRNGPIWVARANGSEIGAAVLANDRETESAVARIALSDSNSACDAGPALIRKLAEQAIGEGHETIVIEAANVSALLATMGFGSACDKTPNPNRCRLDLAFV